MLTRTVCASMVLAAGASIAIAVQTTVAQPQTNNAPQPPTQPAKTPDNQPPAPSIVVHKDTTPNDARDSRVEVGGMKVSMASWSPACPVNPNASLPDHGDVHPVTSAAPTRPDGAVVIPDNTIGPGEPLWSIRERESAARKLAEAQADIARTDAQRSPNDSSYTYPSYNGYGWFGGLNTWGNGYGYRSYGLRGPVTTTVTRFDDLGSTAQRAYADAAYPRLNGSQDARDRAVNQFGRDSLPPIGPTQDAVDRAHNQANHEHPQTTQSQSTPRK